MKQLTFDRKMIRFISGALILSTSLIILVSAVSTVISVTNKSTQLAMKEVEVMTATAEDHFKQYYGLIWSITLDKHIQKYLKAKDNQYEYIGNVNNVLDNVCNMWENINFVSIIRSDGEGQLTKGKTIPYWLPNYEKKLVEDYENSISMRHNVMRMSFTKEYNINGAYTMNIYYPLYSNATIGQKLGTLCININDANLQQLISGADSDKDFKVDTYFVHEDGEIISCTLPNEIGTNFSEVEFDKSQITTTARGNVIMYKKLSDWNFYYVTRINWWELSKDSVRTVTALIVLLSILIMIIIRLAKQMVIKAYEPWGNVVKAMEKVSEGEIETRLRIAESAPDMLVVSTGFNGMMEQLMKLMEQIKEEQHQMDQIRMEALQSQIQPHFLYNTLDCIHWQAVISGNKDISNMVKALAAYYRACLSRGQDIITLSEELEYTRNYLYIQKIRYEDILNYEIISDPQLGQAVIPKLTLQPLVENAIYHGIKMMENKKGYVRIVVSGNAEEILIEVEDNGAGMTEEKINEMNQMILEYSQEFGYGVRNVNRRIQLYYGAKYGLSYHKNVENGVTVEVRLPNRNELKGRHTVL